MTPDDLAERRNWDSAAWRHRDIVLLMDALEQAWALAESRREEANRWAAKFGEQQARAERAEAELEAFRDSGLFEMWTQDRARAERAEQTIREMAADALTREAQYEELERAELARDKWRRQALAEQDNHMAWRARAERAERLMRGKNLSIAAYRAALDRVRALADEMDAAQRSGHTSPTAARIRAAIEGDNQ